ncbi:YihY/virulence factor BrkB family protein [Puniceicoccus vermicola]|uniref:YihY/virulence factor BrkB family protein n=1 Tax=Puniceicoccus vermicola TaxID=388746 RepID=A0A7X1AUH6_9BACT|nr:YihY/virulence factor BrkB family protein [Puniceicoccus vermicola]MBC2600251.1 YihY/virulence factor BrkB family protein [Puniceicoccus vermicola]
MIEYIKDIARGVWKGAMDDHLTIVAAGVTYYLILGIFPAMAALILIYGLFFEPSQIQEQFNQMSGLLPDSLQEGILSQMKDISKKSGQAGLGGILSILLAVWSGSKASRAFIQALNITYNEEETRGFFRVMSNGVILTFSGLVTGTVALALIAILPVVLSFLHLQKESFWIIEIIRWTLLVFLFMTILAVYYRFAPDRKPPEWRWVTPGAVAATVLWIIASNVFSWYVGNFGNFNETYGAFGVAIIFLFWLYFSSFFILLGAELNIAIEKKLRH